MYKRQVHDAEQGALVDGLLQVGARLESFTSSQKMLGDIEVALDEKRIQIATDRSCMERLQKMFWILRPRQQRDGRAGPACVLARALSLIHI